MTNKSWITRRPPIFLLAGLLLAWLCAGGTASAQKLMSSSAWRSQTIDNWKIPRGTKINVRTTEAIKFNGCDGQSFRGIVDRDVFGDSGNVLIYKGSDVELVPRRISDNQVTLDINSIAVNGERFKAQSARPGEERDVVTAENVRTPGVEITRPNEIVDIPEEVLMTFRLTVPFVPQKG